MKDGHARRDMVEVTGKQAPARDGDGIERLRLFRQNDAPQSFIRV